MIQYLFLIFVFTASVLSAGHIDSITNSKPFHGTALNAEDLQGKVILVEFWGTNCPPCVASLPKLQALHEKYKDTGKFQMVGSHVQSKSGKTDQLISKNALTFPIYQQLRLESLDFSGIPYLALLNHKGEIVEKGRFSFDLIEKYIEAAPSKMMAGIDVVHHKNILKKIKMGTSCKSTLNSLLIIAKRKTGTPEGDEAQAIYNRVLKHGQDSLDNAADMTPTAAYTEYETIYKTFTGFDLAKEAQSKRADLKKEKGLVRLAVMRNEFKKQSAKRKLSSRSLTSLTTKVEQFISKQDGSDRVIADAESLLTEIKELIATI